MKREMLLNFERLNWNLNLLSMKRKMLLNFEHLNWNLNLLSLKCEMLLNCKYSNWNLNLLSGIWNAQCYWTLNVQIATLTYYRVFETRNVIQL
jgi:hypothetical protein